MYDGVRKIEPKEYLIKIQNADLICV